MSDSAWVTLTTNDSYALGALVLAHTLKKVNTKYKLAVLVTPGVTDCMKEKLAQVFDLVQLVDVLDSKDAASLALLERPELGVTFTKLHCWKLVQFKKCVFLDADTLVIQNSDDLFEREEFSAAPDVGWPDCFNSGVFVFKPSNETFDALVKLARERGSFDGGDQGLLNTYFADWSLQDGSKRLPFVYNLCSVACYSYLPAFKQFGHNVRIFHFIGNSKPWLQHFDPATCLVQTPAGDQHLGVFLQYWWNIFFDKVHPTLHQKMGGLAAAFSQMTLGVAQTEAQAAFEEKLRKEAWEAGHVDYMGRDSFDNILHKITETLSLGPTAKSAPSEAKKEDSKATEVVKLEGEVANTFSETTQKAVEVGKDEKIEISKNVPSEEQKEAPAEQPQATEPISQSAPEPAMVCENVPVEQPKAAEVTKDKLESAKKPEESKVSSEQAKPSEPKTEVATSGQQPKPEVTPKAQEAVEQLPTVPAQTPPAMAPEAKADIGPAVLVEKEPGVGPAVLVKKDKTEKAPELGPGVVSTVAICPNLAIAEVHKPAEITQPSKDEPQAKDQSCTGAEQPKTDASCNSADKTKDPSKQAEPASEAPKSQPIAQTETAVKAESCTQEPPKTPVVVDSALPKESVNTEAKQEQAVAEKTAEVEAKPNDAAAPKSAVPVKDTPADKMKLSCETEPKKEEVVGKDTASPKCEKTAEQAVPKTPGVIEATPPSTPLSIAPGAVPQVPLQKSAETEKAAGDEVQESKSVKEAAGKMVDTICDKVKEAAGKIVDTICGTPPPTETPEGKKEDTKAAQTAEVKDATPQSVLPSVQALKVDTAIPETPPACTDKQAFAKETTTDSANKCQGKTDCKNASKQDCAGGACALPTDCKFKSCEVKAVAPETTAVEADKSKDSTKANAECKLPQPGEKATAVPADVEKTAAVPETPVPAPEAAKPDSGKFMPEAAVKETEVSGKPKDEQDTSKPLEDTNANKSDSKDPATAGSVPEQPKEADNNVVAAAVQGKPAEADKNANKSGTTKDAAGPGKAAAGAAKKKSAPPKGKPDQVEKKEAAGDSGSASMPVPPPRKKDPKKVTPKPTKPTTKK